jgi:hypothetical protein
MKVLSNPPLGTLVRSRQRIVLLNVPAVDVRLPWARWRQPVGLLQLGAVLGAHGRDVRIIDCLQPPDDGRLVRERIGRVDIDGRSLDLWRFGLSPARVMALLRAWARDGWRPDSIFVSCGLSTWWLGARDLIGALKAHEWAAVPLVLGGAYPTFYPEHAARHTQADTIIVGDVPEARMATPDLRLYPDDQRPHFAGIYLYVPSTWPDHNAPRQPRPASETADEVETKARLGVTTFALFDDWLGPAHREALRAALEAIVRNGRRRTGFVALGNVSPRLIDRDLAALFRRVNFRHLFLHDDVRHTAAGPEHLTSEDDYARCVEALHAAGYRPRTDQICASVLVGLPGEDLAAVAARLVRLASIVGSVNLVPFQYTPGTPEGAAYASWVAGEDGQLDPATLNAQLYPLARRAGASFADYLELTRLAALLNSKYHDRTFDFLGESLTARLVRRSLRDRLWDPFHHQDSPRRVIVLQPVQERGP